MAGSRARDTDFEEPIDEIDLLDEEHEEDSLEDLETEDLVIEEPRVLGVQAIEASPALRVSNGKASVAARRGVRRLKKACTFCEEGSKFIDYKRVDVLQRFITERGTIRSRRKAGTCAKHQRQLAVAIKRARLMALLPFTADHIREV